MQRNTVDFRERTHDVSEPLELTRGFVHQAAMAASTFGSAKKVACAVVSGLRDSFARRPLPGRCKLWRPKPLFGPHLDLQKRAVAAVAKFEHGIES